MSFVNGKGGRQDHGIVKKIKLTVLRGDQSKLSPSTLLTALRRTMDLQASEAARLRYPTELSTELTLLTVTKDAPFNDILSQMAKGPCQAEMRPCRPVEPEKRLVLCSPAPQKIEVAQNSCCSSMIRPQFTIQASTQAPTPPPKIESAPAPSSNGLVRITLKLTNSSASMSKLLSRLP